MARADEPQRGGPGRKSPRATAGFGAGFGEKSHNPAPDKKRVPAEAGANTGRRRLTANRPGKTAGPPDGPRADARADARIGQTVKPVAQRESVLPGAVISRRAADRLRSGHVWVYASELESLELGPGEAPALLPVADNRGILLGTALYSPASQIGLRMISREPIDEPQWLELLAARLRRAIDVRMMMLSPLEGKSDSCRLCFSEADQIPGLVIDKYADLVVLQLLTKGLDRETVRETCVKVLRETLLNPDYGAAREAGGLAAIWERPDPRIRELEGLPAPTAGPLWAANAKAPKTETQFHLNGLSFFYDANAGQKTGAFLDQHANYHSAQKYAWLKAPGGRALDVCTYQGGFALHLARVSKTVTGIDASRGSLEVAERNLKANQAQPKAGIQAEVDWIEADAFEILRDWSAAGQQFDTIVLDPPAFAKSKRAVEGALRGYKELNLRALKMLRPGGLLISCSCSHHVSWADLEGAVAAAAADAGRRVRLLDRLGAAPDHPVVLNLPETEYLKCLVLEKDRD
ncbi:MAG: class I SAM-dependent rRNA methyltransferase [Terracidiphilus sp.]